MKPTPQAATVIRLPDGREVDPVNGHERCGRVDCPARTNPPLSKRSGWGAAEIEASRDCEAHKVDWREVAALLAASPAPTPVKPGIYVRDGVAYFAEVDPARVARRALERAAMICDEMERREVMGRGASAGHDCAVDIRALADNPAEVRAIVEGAKP